MKLIKESLADIKGKKWVYVALLLVIIFGLYLRAYHTDFPVIGYHGWKETHYLTEARNFAEHGFFTHGFFVPYYDFSQLNSDPSGAHADTFPFISIVVGIFFKIFGAKITIARGIDIFFSILAVPAMFLLARKLFKNENVAIVSAFLTALNPMFVFFSHNTQLQNPGILFMLLGAYFYIRWLESDTNKDLIFTSLFVTLSALNVFTFLVILVPMLLTFPWGRIKRFTVSRLKAYGISALIFATIPLWIAYMKFVVEKQTGLTTFSSGLVNLAAIYTTQTRQSIFYNLADNFSFVVLVLSAIGIVAISLMFLRKKKLFGGQLALPAIAVSVLLAGSISYKLGFGLLYVLLFAVLCVLALPIFKKEIHDAELEGNAFTEKFMLFYGVGTFAFFIILSEKLAGHAYHQFPIAPFFILAASYAAVLISSNLGDLFAAKVAVGQALTEGQETTPVDTFKFVKYFAIILLLLIAAYGLPGSGKLFYNSDLAKSSSFDSRARLFNTMFPGPDIAGDYIKAHAGPSDRVLISGGEIMGTLWHADRKGFYGINSVDTIKQAEAAGVKWIFIYPPLRRNELDNPDILNYMKANYGVKQIALAQSGQNYVPIYFLFEKGGTFSDTTLQDIAGKYTPKPKSYDRIGGGKITLLYITVEQ